MTRNSLKTNALRLNTATTIGLLAGLVVGLSAQGQVAAGTGRGLEKDLRVGGGGNTPRRDFGAEVRLRNSLVTGNAAGGRALRITAPYSDPADFRDTLGSSDLFAFRRDSLYSGLGGQGYRGTEGLQYQFGWSTGGSSNLGLTVSRGIAPVGQTPSSLSTPQDSGTPRFATKSWEVATPVTGAMRSTAAFSSTRSLTPTAVGVRQLDNGSREIVAASSLLGLRGIALEEREPWNQSLGQVKTPAPQAALGDVQLKTPESAPTPNPLAARPVGTRMETGAKTESAPSSAGRTAYDDLRARLNSLGSEASKPDAKPDTKPDTKSEPKRDDKTEPTPGPSGNTPTRGTSPATEKPSTDSAAPAEDAQATNSWDSRLESLRRTLGATEQGKQAGDLTPSLDAATIRAIRQAGQQSRTTSAVTTPLGQTNVFADHIEAAEKLMSEGKYFDAEERFTRAITVRPGDANALAGRINAQLGSGLLVSASVNLRTLAVTKPDAIGMLFADNLLPSKKRQAQLLTQLRTNLTLDNKPELRVPKESALLLAYLGYQRSEPSTVREGLESFRKVATPEEQTLLKFLEGVWLDEQGTGK